MNLKNTEDDEKNDFFEEYDKPEEREVKPPKPPVLTPDDPRYWDQEESKWEHLHIRRRRGFRLWIGVAFIAVLLLVAGYLRFFGTNVDSALQFGYVDSIETRGVVFKTFEGVLIPYKELNDTTRIYDRNFVFTAATPELAVRLKELQKAGTPVRVEYKVYNAAVPWRGDSRVMVTAVDSVDPRTILPPEFAPAAGLRRPVRDSITK